MVWASEAAAEGEEEVEGVLVAARAMAAIWAATFDSSSSGGFIGCVGSGCGVVVVVVSNGVESFVLLLVMMVLDCDCGIDSTGSTASLSMLASMRMRLSVSLFASSVFTLIVLEVGLVGIDSNSN